MPVKTPVIHLLLLNTSKLVQDQKQKNKPTTNTDTSETLLSSCIRVYYIDTRYVHEIKSFFKRFLFTLPLSPPLGHNDFG